MTIINKIHFFKQVFKQVLILLSLSFFPSLASDTWRLDEGQNDTDCRPKLFTFSLPDIVTDLYLSEDGALLYIVANQMPVDRSYLWSPETGIKSVDFIPNGLINPPSREEPTLAKVQSTVEYSKNNRVTTVQTWKKIDVNKVIDSLKDKPEFKHNIDTLHRSVFLSAAASSTRTPHQIIAGHAQFERQPQKLPFIYTEKLGARLLEDIFSELQILPPDYKIQEIKTMNTMGTVLAGLGSKFSIWIAYLPEAQNFMVEYQKDNERT